MVSASARRKREKAVIEASIASSAAAAAAAGGGGGPQVWEDYEEDTSRVDGGWCCVADVSEGGVAMTMSISSCSDRSKSFEAARCRWWTLVVARGRS